MCALGACDFKQHLREGVCGRGCAAAVVRRACCLTGAGDCDSEPPLPPSPLLLLKIAAAAEAGEVAARFSSGTLGEASRERFAAGGTGFDGEAGRDGGWEGGWEIGRPPAEALAGCWFGPSPPFSLAASLTLRVAALSRSCRSRPTSGASGCTGGRTKSRRQMHLNGIAVGRSQTCLCHAVQHSCCMRECDYTCLSKPTTTLPRMHLDLSFEGRIRSTDLVALLLEVTAKHLNVPDLPPQDPHLQTGHFAAYTRPLSCDNNRLQDCKRNVVFGVACMQPDAGGLLAAQILA